MSEYQDKAHKDVFHEIVLSSSCLFQIVKESAMPVDATFLDGQKITMLGSKDSSNLIVMLIQTPLNMCRGIQGISYIAKSVIQTVCLGYGTAMTSLQPLQCCKDSPSRIGCHVSSLIKTIYLYRHITTCSVSRWLQLASDVIFVPSGYAYKTGFNSTRITMAYSWQKLIFSAQQYSNHYWWNGKEDCATVIGTDFIL